MLTVGLLLPAGVTAASATPGPAPTKVGGLEPAGAAVQAAAPTDSATGSSDSVQGTLDDGTRTVSFSDGWRFALVNPAGTPTRPARTPTPPPRLRRLGLARGAVPHDWSIEQTPTTGNGTTSGTGFFPGGLGWYRIAFTLPSALAGSGSRSSSTASTWTRTSTATARWSASHPYGYTGFAFDLTDLRAHRRQHRRT